MKKNIVEKIVFAFFGLISIVVVGTIIAILLFIFTKGIGKINFEFLTSVPTNGMMDGGIFPAIVGTFILVVCSCTLAFPVGIFSGIFMNEYAHHNWFKKFVNMMTNNLAGIPSIVFGLFGLAVFVNMLNFGVSVLSGSLTLAILILPVIIRTTEESLKSIPQSFRLASYALGASKLTTIFKVVLPMALPNIITGMIISIGRVAGETAPIIFTVAVFYLHDFHFSLNSPVMALPYHLYVMSTSGIDLEKSRDIAYGTALVLMAIIFIINLLAGLFRHIFKVNKT